MEFNDLLNKSNLLFTNVMSEQERVYHYPDGETLVIHEPIALNVNPAGHRVLDSTGVSYYIPTGWRYLTWKAKKGEPHFIK